MLEVGTVINLRFSNFLKLAQFAHAESIFVIGRIDVQIQLFLFIADFGIGSTIIGMFAILIPSNQSRSYWTPILVPLTLHDILAGNLLNDPWSHLHNDVISTTKLQTVPEGKCQILIKFQYSLGPFYINVIECELTKRNFSEQNGFISLLCMPSF